MGSGSDGRGGRGEFFDEAGEAALGAEGVGVGAEVADDLEHALLEGGGFSAGEVGVAEQPGPGEFEHGVVFAGGPVEVEGFETFATAGFGAGVGSGPEPGEEGVHGEVVQSAGTEEGWGVGELAGGEGIVTAPKAIGIGAEEGEQGGFGGGLGGGEVEIGGQLLVPGFELGFPVAAGDPGCGQGEAALGVVGGANAVETPDFGGEEVGGETFAFAPPEVPETAGAGSFAGFGGEETGQAEQAGLPVFAGDFGIDGESAGFGQAFGDALHGPGVVLIAEGAEDGFPEGLVPADGAGAGAEVEGFGAEPDEGGLFEHGAEGIGAEALEGIAASAFEGGGGEFAGAADPGAEFVERGVELVVEDESGELDVAGGWIPDDVEDHVLVGGVTGVAVALPAGGFEVDFDIARDGFGAVDLEDGVKEIGAAFAVPEAGVENSDLPVFGGGQGIAAEALVGPDFLEPTFRGCRLARVVVERGFRSALGAPFEIGPSGAGHWRKPAARRWRKASTGMGKGEGRPRIPKPWVRIPCKGTDPI